MTQADSLSITELRTDPPPRGKKHPSSLLLCQNHVVASLLQTKIAKVHFYLSSKRNEQDLMCKWHVPGLAWAELPGRTGHCWGLRGLRCIGMLIL